ncbi:MAG TPA: invasin, partial [Colwellia sp.]|nr:invasin [Colwellia sp.]
SAVVNKTVTFTLAVEGSATFDPVAGTATTDANGVATIVVKVSDVPGSVNVIASYESATDNISFDSAGDGIKVVEGEPTAATITLFASTQQLASSGAETITLTAIAKDANNHLVAG